MLTSAQLDQAIDAAAAQATGWLRTLPEWPRHPTNASGSVSSHFGPTIVSEHDCVLHFARHLNAAGVAWEDMHLEFSPGQWMFARARGTDAPTRIDLAVIARDRLAATPLPVAPGELRFDAVFEFALASNYWQFGGGSARASVTKVDADRGLVVVVEECEHRLASTTRVRARAARRRSADPRRWRQWMSPVS